jgi:hypothetical protein
MYGRTPSQTGLRERPSSHFTQAKISMAQDGPESAKQGIMALTSPPGPLFIQGKI